jgi:acyl-CoA synthetase (AMP-forming)/AMP-acid ligase II
MGLGIGPGDRVATLAWNTYRHFELYYGVSGCGAVCHTVNPRLFRDQVIYIVNHAADRIIFTDLTFVPLLEDLWEKLETPEAVVVMTDAAHMPDSSLPKLLCYEDLIEAQPETFDWPRLDERSASALCYMLHLGHHRGAQGRPLRPPLGGPPRAGRNRPHGRLVHLARQLSRDRADVSCLRLGLSLYRAAGGRQDGLPGPGL